MNDGDWLVAAGMENITMAAVTQASGGEGADTNGTAVSGQNPFILPWYLQVIYIIIFVVTVVISAGGNIVVIWIVLAHRRMRTVTNYFLVNLAVADALISILNTLFNFVYMLNNHWPFGGPYCKFTYFIAPCTISASVFTFMAIAVDRYVAIIHPLKPRMPASTVLGVIAVIWLASVIVAVPNLLFAETHTFFYDNGDQRTICYLNWPDGVNSPTDLGYNIFLMLVNYFIPVGLLAGTYFRVGLELWGSQTIGETSKKQQDTVKSKRKVVKMMIVVVTIFSVCWLPQHIFFLVTNQHPSVNEYKNIQHIYLVIYWLAMSNSMYNPIIYCWMNQRFRHGFKYVFRWLPCVKILPSDTMGCPKRLVARMSMTEKSERNGSSMHTMEEPMEHHAHAAGPPAYSAISGRGRHAGFKLIRSDEAAL